MTANHPDNNSPTKPSSGDHEFVPQSFGSAYCGLCRQVFDAPQHGFVSYWQRGPEDSGSVAADVLENMERDYADDQQLLREVFSDDFD